MVSLPCLLGRCNRTGDSFTSHLDNLRTVFDRLRAAELKLKPPKCNFFQQKVQYLGHVVSRDGVTPDPAKVEKVATWPTPTTTKEVQQFLGLASYYRKFIQNFVELATTQANREENTISVDR